MRAISDSRDFSTRAMQLLIPRISDSRVSRLKDISCESLSLAISSRLGYSLMTLAWLTDAEMRITYFRASWFSLLDALHRNRAKNDWRSKSFIKARHEELDEIAAGMTNRRWRIWGRCKRIITSWNDARGKKEGEEKPRERKEMKNTAPERNIFPSCRKHRETGTITGLP